MANTACCSPMQAATHLCYFMQDIYGVAPLLLSFGKEAVHEYHSQFQAISNHFYNSPSAQLHAIMMCMNQKPSPTLDFECTAMINMVILRDFASTPNTGSDCPGVIRLQTSRRSVQNKSKIISSSINRQSSGLNFILQVTRVCIRRRHSLRLQEPKSLPNCSSFMQWATWVFLILLQSGGFTCNIQQFS